MKFKDITRDFSRWCLVAMAICLIVGQAGAADDLPNFHAVSPGIYRGGAPTAQGLAKLKSMGIRAIVDLRISPRQVKAEKAEAQRLGYEWINLPMGSDPPTKRQVATLLATLKRAANAPVYVHCQHGADRTGCMIGIWRETQQGWDFPKTWAEMREYGFNPRWVKLTAAVRARAPQQKKEH